MDKSWFINLHRIVFRIALIGLPLLPLTANGQSSVHSQILGIETLTNEPFVYVLLEGNRDIHSWMIHDYPHQRRITIQMSDSGLGKRPLHWNRKNEKTSWLKRIAYKQSEDGLHLTFVYHRDKVLQFVSSKRQQKGFLLIFKQMNGGSLPAYKPDADALLGPTTGWTVIPENGGDSSSLTMLVAEQKEQRKPFQRASAWKPRVDVVLRPGTERSFGEAELYWPFWQSNTATVSAVVRAQKSDTETQELNAGIAYRQILADRFIVGAYAFADELESVSNNEYQQNTFGVEFLSDIIDVRGNVYQPDDDENLLGTSIVNPGSDSVAINGDQIQIVHSNQTSMNASERALSGYDVEVGYAMPSWLSLPSFDESRIAVGVFDFEETNYIPIEGERFRYETIAYDFDWLGGDMRLTLALEWQNDDVRDDETFLHARLTIPLGKSSKSFANANSRRLYRRMEERIVRDIDVVTNLRTYMVNDPSVTETALDATTGQPIQDQIIIAQADGTGAGTLSDPASLSSAITTAGTTGQTVILRGDGGNFEVAPDSSCPAGPDCGTVTLSSTLPENLVLMGAPSTSFAVISASGYQGTLVVPGSRPTLLWNQNADALAIDSFFTLSNGNRLIGIDFNENNVNGVAALTMATDATGIELDDIVFSGTVLTGIRANANTGYTLSNITFQNPDLGLGMFTALTAGENTTATLRNVNLNSASNPLAFGIITDFTGSTVNAGSFTITDSNFDGGLGLQVSEGSATVSVSNTTVSGGAGSVGFALNAGSYQFNNNTVNTDIGITTSPATSPTLSGSGNTFAAGGTMICSNNGTPTGTIQFTTGSCP